MTKIEHIFSNDGALAETIEGYQPRTAQIEMATTLAEALKNKQHLIAEAGTGTGKTFAYLIPAILSTKKVIVSTATKNLQEQLFSHDLPLIRNVLTDTPVKAALLKGRANYLCHYRLRNALTLTEGFNKQETALLTKIKSWATRSRDGDIAQMTSINESNPIWYQATSTRENCLGSECPDYNECFLVKARRNAQEADLIIVNHYLLCADGTLRETGFGELLPDAEIIIIDEAHQLAEIASNFLGVALSAKQFNDLSDDSLVEYFQGAKDIPDLRTACEDLKHEVQDLRLAFGTEIKKAEWQEIENNPKIFAALHCFKDQVQRLETQLSIAAEKSTGLESCYQRCTDLNLQLQALVNNKDDSAIRWYETHRLSFTLGSTPLEISTEFRSFMQQHKASWIFTSATLSIAKRFDHFKKTLGLEAIPSYHWDSPFDYPNQALFYHPKGLPQPNDADAIERIIEFALPVLKASQGRAFFLFTSYRNLNRAEELLKDKLDYSLLVQGSRPKTVLLDEFKRDGNAILLGTSSFWEGVDVRGEALSCVIIDKLPFASPFEPVLKARLAAMKKQGRNGFFEYQVPAAAIALRQGVGRLIRDIDDRGVLMVCDPRLLKRAYGQTFLDSVPNMQRTRDIKEVEKFFTLSNEIT
ncbi:MAG: ATP-dependent DNA helicase [Methylococcales bacterium]|nr:ATP-dependent DNA helicase [Methylococcales bacterium]